MRRRHLLEALLVLPFTAGAAFASEKRKSGGTGYVQLPTLTAVILRPDGRRGVLTVEVGLDAPDLALHERLDLLGPRLRDAYAATLRSFGANLRPGEPPDLEQLSARLQADTDRIAGRRGARLLLGSVLVN